MTHSSGTSPLRVCFVTNEIYPEDKGGIGRVIYNFIVYNQTLENPSDIHILLGGAFTEDTSKVHRITQILNGLAKVHVTPRLTNMADPLPHLLGWAGKTAPNDLDGRLALSHSYYEGLLMAEEAIDHEFDIVEFPDFGGWGMVSMEAKRAGLAFQNTLLSVRVHSTQGLLYRVERFAHVPGSWLAGQFDTERFTLTNADLVAGHIPSVLHENLDHYNLRETLADKTVIEFPPILIDATEAKLLKKVKRSKGAVRDFIFSSRLQQFKRPDIFVRAATEFLDTHPGYEGVFRLVSYGWDNEYIDMLHDLVPLAYADQILFVNNATAEERLNHIAQSIVVQPSDYESLCLFAYEAALMGQKVILNGDAVAFGDFERWKDAENCLLFDGSVSGLAVAMEKALNWEPTSTVSVTPDRPYWNTPVTAPAPIQKPKGAQTISLICYGAEDFFTLRQQHGNAMQLKRKAETLNLNVEVTFLLSAATFNNQDADLDMQGCQIQFSPGLRFDPEKLQQTIQGSAHDIIFLLPTHAEVNSKFFIAGLQAMLGNSRIDMLGGHVEMYDETTGQVQGLRAYGGSMPSTALISSRILPETCFMRQSVFDTVSLDFRAGPLWFEAFARDCVLSDMAVSIIPQLAARFSAWRMQYIENSIKLDAGVIDSFGIKSKLQARLLALNTGTAQGSTEQARASHESLKSASLFSPAKSPVDWRPVELNPELGGLLVHPLKGHITVARIPAQSKRPRRISVNIKNNNAQNSGAEVALAYGRGTISEKDFLRMLKQGSDHADFNIGHWKKIRPEQKLEYSISIHNPDVETGTLFLISRVPRWRSPNNCHIVFSDLEFWFTD